MNELEVWADAERLISIGRVKEAVPSYQKLRDSSQLGIAARMRLSMIAGRLGNLRGATDEAEAAGRSNLGSDPHALSMLFKRLITLGEHERALEVSQRPALQQCSEIEPLVEVGKLLSDYGFSAEAEILLKRAQSCGLASAGLSFLLGTCSMRLGDLDTAEQHFEAGIQTEPRFAPTHWYVAKLRRQRADSNHVDRLRKELARAQAGPDSVMLGYALFKELDDLGDYESAWKAWSTAARTMKVSIGYDVNRDVKLLRSIEDADRSLKTLPASATANASSATLTPIFIVGLPRSGTTLLERAYGMHSAVTACGELADLLVQLRYVVNLPGPPSLDLDLVGRCNRVDWNLVGGRYLEHVHWRSAGARCITDKMPTNFRLIGTILRALPHARIIHMTRDPVAACFSNLRECFFGGSYGYSNDLDDMATYFKSYRTLMNYWQSAYAGRVHTINYADLVTDTENELRQAMAFCDLPWEQDCLHTDRNRAAVSSASSTQVREPIHTRSVEHWKNYQQQLQPMMDALSDG